MNTSSPSYPEFKGRRVLVTGGSQGIGKAIAGRLARHGAQVHCNYFGDDAMAQETAHEFRAAGHTVHLHKADVGSPEAVEAMLAEIHRSGPLDVLVCNAAYQERKDSSTPTGLCSSVRSESTSSAISN